MDAPREKEVLVEGGFHDNACKLLALVRTKTNPACSACNPSRISQDISGLIMSKHLCVVSEEIA